MHVRVDLATGAATLEDPADLGRFHVLAVGDGDVGAALRAAEVGAPDPDDPAGHAWVEVAAVRRLAAGQVDERWDAGFEGMLGYAAGKGWLDEGATRLRAHVERAAAGG